MAENEVRLDEGDLDISYRVFSVTRMDDEPEYLAALSGDGSVWLTWDDCILIRDWFDELLTTYKGRKDGHADDQH